VGVGGVGGINSDFRFGSTTLMALELYIHSLTSVSG